MSLLDVFLYAMAAAFGLFVGVVAFYLAIAAICFSLAFVIQVYESVFWRSR